MKPSGAARQLVTFLASPRKVTQRRRPQFLHPFGIPSVARQVRLPHKLARSAARPRTQTCSSEFPDSPVLLGGGYGDPKSKTVLCEGALHPHGFLGLDFGVRYAHIWFCSSLWCAGLAVNSLSVSLRAGDKIGEKARTV
jgi:hypothetical protein